MKNEKPNSETDENSDDEYKRGGIIRRKKRVSKVKKTTQLLNKNIINIKIATDKQQPKRVYKARTKKDKVGAGYAPVSEIRTPYSSNYNPQSAPGNSFVNPTNYDLLPQFTTAPELLKNPASITDVNQLNDRLSIETTDKNISREIKKLEERRDSIYSIPFIKGASKSQDVYYMGVGDSSQPPRRKIEIDYTDVKPISFMVKQNQIQKQKDTDNYANQLNKHALPLNEKDEVEVEESIKHKTNHNSEIMKKLRDTYQKRKNDYD